MSDIVYWPNKVLSEVSKPVDHLSKFQIEPITIEEISKALLFVMRQHKGVGLSAIQIGVPLRMFVMDCSGITQFEKNESNSQPAEMVCINPEIVKFIGLPIEMTEGCLSFPGVFEKVMRHPEVILKCEDLTGEVKTWQLAGIESQCVQHEINHLNGQTFADSWGLAKRDLMKRKIRKTLVIK